MPSPNLSQSYADGECGRGTYVWLALIVAAYLALALAYARATPAWQAPDEPAHYNYVAYLAEHAQLPVLQPGDYPAGKVPIGPEVRLTDISDFRYEAHQPPLFYALAAVLFKLHPTVFALRALSALFGAALLPVAFACARLTLLARPWLWLGIAAFAGFIPMHLFVAGSIENDSLADLVLSLLVLAYLALATGWQNRWRWAAVGLLLGLALLTKVTIYPAAVLLFSLSLWERAGERARAAGTALAVAAAVAGWSFIRNGLTYGWSDLLVQGRQAAVAGSQVQTGTFGIAELWRFVATSFHSFWGQFGWMSVPLSEREYQALIGLTALAFLGWMVFLARRGSLTLPSPAAAGEGLFLTWLGVLAGDLAYNLKFVQPQGRYLLPALVPIAFFYVCGFAALFPRRARPAAVGLLSVGLLAFSAYALQRDLIPSFR